MTGNEGIQSMGNMMEFGIMKRIETVSIEKQSENDWKSAVLGLKS